MKGLEGRFWPLGNGKNKGIRLYATGKDPGDIGLLSKTKIKQITTATTTTTKDPKQ